MNIFGCCPCWPSNKPNYPGLLKEEKKVPAITMPPKSVYLTIESSSTDFIRENGLRENGLYESLFGGTSHYTGFTKKVIKSNQWIITCDEEDSKPTCNVGRQTIKIKGLFSDTIGAEVTIKVHAINTSDEQKEITDH